MGGVKGIFHPHFSNFQLFKDLGFNYVEVSLGIGILDFENLAIVLDQAHALGLNVFLNPGFDQNFINAYYFLKNARVHPDDIIFICDEPNDRKIPKKDVDRWARLSKHFFPKNKTMLTLTASAPWAYANLTDIAAIDYYGPLKWIDRFKLDLKVKMMKKVHKGQVFGIPPVRNSMSEMLEYFELWQRMKADGILWYSATPEQEKPPWFPGNLADTRMAQEALKIANGRT